MAKKNKNNSGFISKKSAHPATSFRKRLRKKELRRNREQRDQKLNESIKSRDEQSLVKEIEKYDILEKRIGKLTSRLAFRRSRLQEAVSDMKNKPKKLIGRDNRPEIDNKITNFSKINDQNEKPAKSVIPENVLAQLESFDTDGAPFFPPGLDFPAELKKPPGEIFLLKDSDGNQNGIDFAQNSSDFDQNAFNKIEVVKIKKGGFIESRNKAAQRKFERELALDPLSPTNQNYLTGPISQPQPENAQNFAINKNFKLNEKTEIFGSKFDKKDIIGPKFEKTSEIWQISRKNDQNFPVEKGNENKPNLNLNSRNDHSKVSYSRPEKYQKISKEALAMVPSSVIARSTKAPKKALLSNRLSIAPVIKDTKSEDYDKFMQDIANIEAN